MEVICIDERAEDVLPKKPPKGGIVYLNNYKQSVPVFDKPDRF